MLLQVYELPNLHLEGKMCRTNLVPRTIVRGPGFLNAVMIMEQVTLILPHPTSLLPAHASLPRHNHPMQLSPTLYQKESRIASIMTR